MLFFHQQPGNGGGVTQVDGQFQVRPAEERMLAGEPANQAGPFRIQCQVLVPEGLMAQFGDAVEAVATTIVQG